MNKPLSYVFFAIFLIALFLFERIQMFTDDIVEVSRNMRLCVLAMFFICCIAIYTTGDGSIRNNICYKRFLRFIILLYSISFFVSLFVPFSARITYLTIILPILSCCYIYYMTIYIGSLNNILWGIVAVFVALAYFYLLNYRTNIMYDITKQSNAVYGAFYFFPFLLCIKNKWLRIIGVFVAMVITLYSIKRGGFFALFIGLLVYLVINEIILKKQKIGGIIIFLVAAMVITFFVVQYNAVNENLVFDRLSDISESGGSGRVDIWRSKIQLISDSSPVGLILGHGWCSAEIDAPRNNFSAHNDFLEVLYDFGVIAFVLYLLLYYSLFKYCRELILKKSIYAAPFGASLVVFFVNSMVSHFVIYPKYFVIIAMFWGYIMAADKMGTISNNFVDTK